LDLPWVTWDKDLREANDIGPFTSSLLDQSDRFVNAPFQVVPAWFGLDSSYFAFGRHCENIDKKKRVLFLLVQRMGFDCLWTYLCATFTPLSYLAYDKPSIINSPAICHLRWMSESTLSIDLMQISESTIIPGFLSYSDGSPPITIRVE
jgi:hypothetical protein